MAIVAMGGFAVINTNKKQKKYLTILVILDIEKQKQM